MPRISARDTTNDPLIGIVTFYELWICLKLGIADFRAAPQFGLGFSAVYVVVGLVIRWLGADHVPWILATSLGFPLVAPLCAVGLYEVSRRLEAGLPLRWVDVVCVIWDKRTRQVPWIGAIIVLYFLLWTFLAHAIFGAFMGELQAEIDTMFDMFSTSLGQVVLLIEVAVGGIVAFMLFSLTVVSLPLVLDRDVDFVKAMKLSFACVQSNFFVMLVWAAVVGVLTLAALMPWFLGLLVVLPVLGHATWHLYRRALYDQV